MPVLEKKKIGSTEVKGRGAPSPTTSPTPAPSALIRNFITEHRRIKRLLEKGTCMRVSAIAEQTGLSEDKVRAHIDVFASGGYIQRPAKDAVCSSEALTKLKDTLDKMRRK